MTGSIFFVRAVCANSGAKVDLSSSWLRVVHCWHCMGTVDVWGREAPQRDTNVHSVSPSHFTCMLMLCFRADWKGWFHQSVIGGRYLQRTTIMKAVKASIYPTFQNRKNWKKNHPFRFFGLHLFSSSNFNIVKAVKPLVKGNLNFHYNFNVRGQNLVPHEVVLLFTTHMINCTLILTKHCNFTLLKDFFSPTKLIASHIYLPE